MIEYPSAVLLGTAQDAGFPSAGCQRPCCRRSLEDPSLSRYPASLVVVDRGRGRWLLDCTPEFPRQLAMLEKLVPAISPQPGLRGIFLTHAHIGHYTGLMQLGRESLGAEGLPVYCMPRMKRFLLDNGPWNQLVQIGNIELREISPVSPVTLPGSIGIQAVPVTHRAEYSETVAYIIRSDTRSLLYLPDIDCWDDPLFSVEELIDEVDVALLDGTFFDGNELPGRDMQEIPHPTVESSLRRFAGLPERIRRKIHFFHFNHTNPLLNEHSTEYARVAEAGFSIARQEQIFSLD